MGIYVFSRDVLLETLAQEPGLDFGHEIIPSLLSRRRVNAFLFRGYWADVGTVESFYNANIMITEPTAPFSFYDPRRPIYTRPRFLPGSRLNDCTIDRAIVAEGCFLDRSTIRDSVVGIRTQVRGGCHITRSVLVGADFYEADDDVPRTNEVPRLGIGRNVVLDRVIVDKNARIGNDVRLVNEAGTQQADGDGYYIRGGIVIVPKGGIVKDGTIV
jgi:glucose-1-phosphate adenylyltransferase